MNKLWNSARFVMMNIDNEPKQISDDLIILTETDQWIISRLNKTILNVNNSYDQYKLNESIKLFEAETNKNNPYPGFSKN